MLGERATLTLTQAAAGELGVTEQRTAPAVGSFFVRGLTGTGVSVYRDSIRYTTSAQRGGVSTFPNLVAPALLESVEVLRGPDSAQYGSDSLGGTVNLLSVTSSPTTSAASRTASNDTTNRSAATATISPDLRNLMPDFGYLRFLFQRSAISAQWPADCRMLKADS